MEKNITLNLSAPKVQIVLDHLKIGQYQVVKDLIEDIFSQAKTQIQEAEKESEPK